MNTTQLIRSVIIPARADHSGNDAITVTLAWKCPVCDGPRGEPFDGESYDGSRRLAVHAWRNPCGHLDKYSDLRKEALNGTVPDSTNGITESVQRLSALALTHYSHNTFVRDLLADLRHYCDEHGLDFAREDRAAYARYTTELMDRL